MFWQIFALLIGFGSSFARAEINTTDYQAAFDAIVNEVQDSGILQPLGRDVYVFSYGHTRPDEDPGKLVYAKAISSVIAGFYNEDQTGNEDDYAGTGLYAAIDPIITQSYGKSNGAASETRSMREFPFVLKEFPLDRNLKALHLESLAGIFSRTTAKLVQKAGCPKVPGAYGVIDYSASLSSMLSSMGDDNDHKVAAPKECRRLALNVLKKLQVDVLLYNYYASNFPNCRSNVTTMVLINPDFANPGRFKIFTPQIPANEEAWSRRDRTPLFQNLFDTKGLNLVWMLN